VRRVVPLYVGILLVVLLSLSGLVAVPERQLGGLEPVELPDGRLYPVEPAGLVAEGRRVYIAEGCIYCHSQQVRPEGFGADIERGWGTRRTVARDYIFDRPPLLGTMRTGPDLASIGARQPSADWHYLHLYDPRLTSPGSIMPPFRFLFEEVPATVERPAEALRFPPGAGPEGRFVVPTRRARALVAYLLSLDRTAPLPEAGR